MKRTVLIFGMLVLAAARLAAQSVLPDPAHMRVEYEDERLRVIRLTLPAGEATPMMELNERLTTSFSKAKLRITRAGVLEQRSATQQRTTEHEAAGQVFIENIGTTEWHCVITEFKGQFAKALPGKQSPAVAQEPAVVRPQP